MESHVRNSLGWLALATLVGAATGCQSFKNSLADRAYERMVASADEQKEAFHFYDAYELYSTVALDVHERALKDSSVVEDPEVYRNAIDCAIRAGNLMAAVAMSDTLIGAGLGDQQDWNQRVNLALNLGNDASARAILTEASAVFPGKPWIEEMMAGLETLEKFQEIDVEAEVWAFRPNSGNMEFGASQLGEDVVFVRSSKSTDITTMVDGWTGRKFTTIVSVPMSDSTARESVYARSQLSSQSLLSTVIPNEHDGPVSFSSDGLRMYLTRNHGTAVKDKEGRDAKNLKVDVFAREPGKKWVLQEDAIGFNHPSYSVAHAVEDTARNLIFASDMPGSRGGLDLWVSEWKDGQYQQPQNLGDKVNTRGDEKFPFVDGVNQLFYSTDGRSGLGGMDIYRHDMASGLTELLGAPINSHADDFAYFVDDAGMGFLSSNRDEDVDRIFRVKMGEVTAPFEVTLVTCDGLAVANQPIVVHDTYTDARKEVMSSPEGVVRFDAPLGHMMALRFAGNGELAPFDLEGLRAADKVLYQDQAVLTYDQPQNDLAVRLEPNKAITEPLAVTFFGPDMEHQSMLTNLEGELTWDVEAMLGYTSIKVDHIGYRTGTAPLMDQSACPKGESIVMTLNQEVVIDLELIYYDLDDAALRPASKQELDKLVNYMNEVPYVRVELSSYTDSRGPKEYNDYLSQTRAQKCVDYIIAKGVAPSRIEAAGYGETKPLNKCVDGVWCNERMHQENRRTELRFLVN